MGRTIAVVLALMVAAAAEEPVSSRAAQANAIFHEADGLLLQITNDHERDYVVSELAQAQVRARFASEAVSTASRSKDSVAVLVDVGRIQASQGQYDSAMVTVAGQDSRIKDLVRLAIGVEQARRGDVQLALQTAAAMLDGYEQQSVLYFAALELMRQGQTARARKIALSFTAPDHELPDESIVGPSYDWRKPAPPPPLKQTTQPRDFYQRAVAQLQSGNLRKAISLIEADDNPADVSSNFSRLAREAATSWGISMRHCNSQQESTFPEQTMRKDITATRCYPSDGCGEHRTERPLRDGQGTGLLLLKEFLPCQASLRGLR